MNKNIIQYENGLDFHTEADDTSFVDEVDVMDKQIADLEKLVETACSHGNYDYDEYTYGMANGMILALAVMKDEEPQYLDRPERWLWDLSDTEAYPLGAAGEYGTQPEPCSTRDDGWDAPDENVELDGDFWDQPDVKEALEEGAKYIADRFDEQILADMKEEAIPIRIEIDQQVIAELTEEINLEDYERAMKDL